MDYYSLVEKWNSRSRPCKVCKSHVDVCNAFLFWRPMFFPIVFGILLLSVYLYPSPSNTHSFSIKTVSKSEKLKHQKVSLCPLRIHCILYSNLKGGRTNARTKVAFYVYGNSNNGQFRVYVYRPCITGIKVNKLAYHCHFLGRDGTNHCQKLLNRGKCAAKEVAISTGSSVRCKELPRNLSPFVWICILSICRVSVPLNRLSD